MKNRKTIIKTQLKIKTKTKYKCKQKTTVRKNTELYARVNVKWLGGKKMSSNLVKGLFVNVYIL